MELWGLAVTNPPGLSGMGIDKIPNVQSSLYMKEAYFHTLKAVAWGSAFHFSTHLGADGNPPSGPLQVTGVALEEDFTHAWCTSFWLPGSGDQQDLH